MKNEANRDKTSIAIISLYPDNTGTSIVVNYYYRALIELGFAAKLYQLVSDNRISTYPNADEYIYGMNILPKGLQLPINIIFTLPKKIRSMTEDILIITDQAASNLNKGRRNSITIVHDVRELTNYNNTLKKLYFKFILKYLKDSSHIIAVSEFTKELLAKRFDLKDRVSVVPNCFPNQDYSAIATVRMNQGVTGKKIVNVLYVAADRPYKNIDLFLKVAEKISSLTFSLDFHFILVSNLKKKTKKKIRKLNLQNLQVMHNVENMDSIYEICDVLMHPSLIEGFGLPIVEAMSHGIPVVHSNLRPMADIVGEGGLSVDPNVIDDWVNALYKVCIPKNYIELSKAAYFQAREFEYEEFKQKLEQVMTNYTSKKPNFS